MSKMDTVETSNNTKHSGTVFAIKIAIFVALFLVLVQHCIALLLPKSKLCEHGKNFNIFYIISIDF